MAEMYLVHFHCNLIIFLKHNKEQGFLVVSSVTGGWGKEERQRQTGQVPVPGDLAWLLGCAVLFCASC